MSPSGKARDFDSRIRQFKSGHPSQKKALAQASAFFNEARLAAHEASCEATREAGLRPMKRAFGTRKTSRALRFTATKLPLHTSVASASYRRRRCFIVIRGQIRTATHLSKPFKNPYHSKIIYKAIDAKSFWIDLDQ